MTRPSAAALLGAAGIAVLLPLLPAAAQGATLASNVRLARAGALGFASFYMERVFTTGANASDGFTLGSVELRLSTTDHTDGNAAPVRKFYSGSARGTSVATLVGPSAALPGNTTANHTYAVPSGSTVALEDSTSCWLVADASSTSSRVGWEATGADDEDATSPGGWAIDNFGGWTSSASGTFSG